MIITSFWLTIFYLIYRYFKNKRLNPIKKALKNNYTSNRKSIATRDRFTEKKIPKDLDAIIIGSGAGSLTTAGLLARFGKKVLVLEGHYIAGGCTHTFKDKGFEFDTGVHYVGRAHKTRRILDVITNQKIIWDKLGYEDRNYVYDSIIVRNRRFNFVPDKVNWLKLMCRYFPKEKQALRKYVFLVEQIAGMKVWYVSKLIKSTWWSTFINYWFAGEFFQMAKMSTYDMLKTLTNNEELITVLCGQFGDLGLPPKKSSFYMHCAVVNHYFDGGFYPRGGPGEIAKNIIPTIEKAGGRVLVSKKVEKIIVKNNKAVGVVMENGTKIFSKIVISGAGVNNTYRNLLNPNVDYCYKLNKIGFSDSLLYLFVGLNKSAKELDLRSFNIWSIPEKNIDHVLDEFNKDPHTADMISFVSSPSSKDLSWEYRHKNKSTAVVMVPIKYSLFAKWKNNKNKEYLEFKKILEKRMLDTLYKHYPKTRGNVAYTSLGTPLTYNTYIGSLFGEVYGASSSKKRFKIKDFLKPYTEIENLYLTGQDILSLGFGGAVVSGYFTANCVLGYNIFNMAMGQDCVKDIKKCLEENNING